jgi:hypothetical protein
MLLVSDTTGNARWASSFSGTMSASGITGGTQNYVTKFGAGGNGLVISQIFDDGTNVGIGTATPTAKLEINGQVKITGGGFGTGKILVSDATGLASWQSSVPASSVNAANITG